MINFILHCILKKLEDIINLDIFISCIMQNNWRINHGCTQTLDA